MESESNTADVGTILVYCSRINEESFQRSLYFHSLGRHNDAATEIRIALAKYNKLLVEFGTALPTELREQSALCIDVYEKLKSGDPDIINVPEKVLYISSRIGSYTFYPWISSSGFYDSSTTAFEDPDGLLELSAGQISRFRAWERVGKVMKVTPSMGVPNELDVHQDVLHNCSLISSFLSILALNKRTSRNCLIGNFYPRDGSGPIVSKSGRYIIRLNVNGTWRKVAIDDRVPCSNDGSSLIVYSNGGVLWPALIEKAYVKVMGGYDFAGSHAAYDSFVLTEWIPEYISLKIYLEGPGKSQEQLWQKLVTGWGNGDLMICVGTGTLLPEESQAFGLASDHDYAILDLKLDGVTKMVKIRNPWEQQLHTAESISWIEFSALFRWFDHLYLNWNPQLYEYKTTVHFVWSLDSALFGQESNNLLKCPQYTVTNNSSEAAMVSILLLRHLNGPQSLKVRSEYLRLTIYDTDSHIVLSEEAGKLASSPAINTSYITLNIPIAAKTSVLVVVTGENIEPSSTSLRLTLTVFSSVLLTLEKTKSTWSHRSLKQGKWTNDSSPGNWSNEDFYKNPQFQLSVNANANFIKIYAFSPLTVPIHVFLFWGNGKIVKTFTEQDIVSSSGKYRQNHCICAVRNMLKGKYTVVVSTFEPVTGPFSIYSFADVPLSLEAINTETLVGVG
jgi:calpain-7